MINFLKQACRIAHGDTDMSIEISKVWQALEIDDQSQEYPAEIIVTTVDSLKNKEFIEEGDAYDHIKVTRKGFDYVLSLHQEPPSNYGVVSQEEANRLTQDVLRFVYNHTKDNEEKYVLASEIKNETLNSYGETVLHQVIDLLAGRGLIDQSNRRDGSDQGWRISGSGRRKFNE
jgi:hypothetical protein